MCLGGSFECFDVIAGNFDEGLEVGRGLSGDPSSVEVRVPYHVWWIRVAFVVLAFGSFLCSVVAGRSRVDLKMSMAVRSAVFGPGLSPSSSLASITLVWEMWYEAWGESV